MEEELSIERDRRQRRDSQQPSVWNCATFLRLTSVVPSREEFACSATSAATMIGGQCDAQSHALVIGKSLVCTSVKQEEF